MLVGTLRGSTAGGSTLPSAGAASPLRSPQVERLRSTDAARSQTKPGLPSNKPRTVSEKLDGLKHRTKTPKRTSADRYAVFLFWNLYCYHNIIKVTNFCYLSVF